MIKLIPTKQAHLSELTRCIVCWGLPVESHWCWEKYQRVGWGRWRVYQHTLHCTLTGRYPAVYRSTEKVVVRVLTERVMVSLPINWESSGQDADWESSGKDAERNKIAFFCKSSSRLDFHIIFNVGIDMILFWKWPPGNAHFSIRVQKSENGV